MRFSVVIPTYNRSDRLKSALDSVLAQTFSDYEIIVVDDGSTDGTQTMLKPYPSVRVLAQANQGPAGARNAGIRAAAGEIVSFLDSDDRWASDKLERHAAYLDSNPGVALVHGYFETVGDDGKPLPAAESRRRWWDDFRTREDGYENWLGEKGCGIHLSAVSIRRDALQKAGGFDSAFRVCEDYDLFLRIALDGTVGSVGGPPVSYFRYHGSIPIETVNAAQIDVLKKHLEILGSGKFTSIDQNRCIIQIKQTLTRLLFIAERPGEGRKYFQELLMTSPAAVVKNPYLKYYVSSWIPQDWRKMLRGIRKVFYAKV